MRRWLLLGLLATLGAPAAHSDSFDDERAAAGSMFDGSGPAAPALKSLKAPGKQPDPATAPPPSGPQRIEVEPQPVPVKKKPATVPPLATPTKTAKTTEAAEVPTSAGTQLAPLAWAQDPLYRSYQRAIRDNQALDDAADDLHGQDMAECDRRIALIRGSTLSAAEQRSRIDCIEEQRRLLARIHRERRRAFGEQEDLLLKKAYQRVKDIQPEAIR